MRAFGVREGRVVLTFDRDYGRLLYKESPEESLVSVQITLLRKVAINVPAM